MMIIVRLLPCEERQRARAKNSFTIDCVGYAVSRRQKIPFLTRDREFEDIEAVEFVR